MTKLIKKSTNDGNIKKGNENVKKGKEFEGFVEDIVRHTLFNKKSITLRKDLCKVKEKPKYFVSDREEFCEFDWSIESWPENSNYPDIILIIECKSYSKSCQPDVLEAKIGLLSEGYICYGEDKKKISIKHVFLIDARAKGDERLYSQTFFNKAKNTSTKIIEVVGKRKYNIVLHSAKNKITNKIPKNYLHEYLNNEVTEFLSLNTTTQKLKKYTKKELESIAKIEYSDYEIKNPKLVCIQSLSSFIEKKYGIKVVKKNLKKLGNSLNKEILGYFDRDKKSIFVCTTIDSRRQLFVLGHEFGHFLLHKDVCNTQSDYFRYLNFCDSKYNTFTDRYDLNNEKNFLEWQANFFSSSFLVNKKHIMNELITYQYEKLELAKGRSYYLYLDNQKCNIDDYYKTLNHLVLTFGLTKSVIENILDSLEVIIKA